MSEKDFFTKEELVKLISEVVKTTIEENYKVKDQPKPKTNKQKIVQPAQPVPVTPKPIPTTPKLNVPKSNFWVLLIKTITLIFVLMFVSWAVISYFTWANKKLRTPPAPISQTYITKSESNELSSIDGIKTVQLARVYYIRAKLNSGKIQIRTGGSDSWRMNNPGMILYGNYAAKMGAVAKFDEFAIFPSYEQGKLALKKMLFESELGFKDNKLINAIRSFAPKENGYDPDTYAKKIADTLAVDINVEMLSLNDDQKNKLIDIIQKQENWDVGRIVEFESEEEWKKKGY